MSSKTVIKYLRIIGAGKLVLLCYVYSRKRPDGVMSDTEISRIQRYNKTFNEREDMRDRVNDREHTGTRCRRRNIVVLLKQGP